MLYDSEHASGQKVNLDKSTILFSTKTPNEQKDVLANIMGMSVVDRFDNISVSPCVLARTKLMSLNSL